jgi:hypothetical protein
MTKTQLFKEVLENNKVDKSNIQAAIKAQEERYKNFSPSDFDEKSIVADVERIYAKAGLGKPKVVICDSPLKYEAAYNEIKLFNSIYSDKTLREIVAKKYSLEDKPLVSVAQKMSKYINPYIYWTNFTTQGYYDHSKRKYMNTPEMVKTKEGETAPKSYLESLNSRIFKSYEDYNLALMTHTMAPHRLDDTALIGDNIPHNIAYTSLSKLNTRHPNVSLMYVNLKDVIAFQALKEIKPSICFDTLRGGNISWLAISQGCFIDQVVLLCRKPVKVKEKTIRNRKVIHCEDGPAIIYADGSGVYMWGGELVPAKWIEDKASVTAADCRVRNIEKRRVLIEILGVEDYFAKLGGKGLTVVDEQLDNQGNRMRLLQFEILRTKILVYEGICPSTGRVYNMRTLNNTVKNVWEAKAQILGITVEQCKKLKIET